MTAFHHQDSLCISLADTNPSVLPRGPLLYNELACTSSYLKVSSPSVAMTETSHFGQEPEPHDAGLEVKPQEIGLEVRQLHSNLEVYQVYNPHQTSEQRANRNEEAAYKEAVPQKKIFGLPRQTFWLLVVLAVVVISGVVGGGVGGSVAVQKAK